MASFICQTCGDSFAMPQRVLDKYPGWAPSHCASCHTSKSSVSGGAPRASTSSSGSGGSKSKRRRTATASQLLTTDQVLEQFTDGPQSGVFTDGGSVPNPGPGGWGAVYVVDGEVLAEAHGHEPDTTNNRMELQALIEAAHLVPEGTPAVVYSDSRLSVNTINDWAAGWERRGWKRKSGPVENLDLVQRAFYAFRSRPELTLEWIAAHSGYRWNEYADALASRWRV